MTLIHIILTAYHCKCIDPWLTKRKKTCPVCKRKVIPGTNPDSDSESDEESEGTSERSPLLAGNNNNQVMDTPRRSTFDNSGSHLHSFNNVQLFTFYEVNTMF